MTCFRNIAEKKHGKQVNKGWSVVSSEISLSNYYNIPPCRMTQKTKGFNVQCQKPNPESLTVLREYG